MLSQNALNQVEVLEKEMRRLAKKYEQIREKVSQIKVDAARRAQKRAMGVVEDNEIKSRKRAREYKKVVEETMQGVNVEDIFASFSQGGHPDDVIEDGFAPGFTRPRSS